MKKRIFFCLFVVAAVYTVNAQSWNPVSTGISGDAANTTWSLFAHDSVLYAGGRFNMAGATYANDIAQWDNVSWGTVGAGTGGFINAMAWYNGNLYAGGMFDTMGGVICHNVAIWNGTTWAAAGKGMRTVEYGIYSMAVYNGNLYAGGSFDSAGGKLSYGISEWDGSNWAALGTGIYAADEDDGVFAMTEYNGELYVGGGFDSAGGVKVHEIAKWDGTRWYDVGGGTNGAIYSLAVYNGNLYAGGQFDTAGGAPANNIAMWNGTSWSALNGGITGENGWAIITALAVYNGELYVGGYFDTVDNKFMNCIARWNGINWSPVGTGINIGGGLDAMAVYDSALYIGGGFDSAGGIYAKNIAMWTAPSAVERINDANHLNIYPNPAANYLNVTSSIPFNNAEYSVYNELGQQSMHGVLDPKQKRIDITALSSGLYMLILKTTGGVYEDKFIKMR